MKTAEVHITSTGASLFTSDYRVFDEQVKSFVDIEAAQAWVKSQYTGKRSQPIYVDKNDGSTVRVGRVYRYRNADFSHAPVEWWNQQDWVEVYSVDRTVVL